MRSWWSATLFVLACGARSALDVPDCDDSGPDVLPVVEAGHDASFDVHVVDVVEDGEAEAACTPLVPIDATTPDAGTADWWRTSSSLATELTQDHEGHVVASGGYPNVVLAKFDTMGQVLATKTYGTGDNEVTVAVAPDDTLWVVGETGNANFHVDFGFGALPPWTGYLVHLDASGLALSQRLFVGSGKAAPYTLTVTASGDVVIAGSLFGSADFGGGSMTALATNSIFIARYSACGEYVYAKLFGQTGSDWADSLTTDAVGNLYLFGEFSGVIDFGGGPLNVPQSGYNLFLAQLDATGGFVAARDFDAAGDYTRGHSVKLDDSGDVVLVGEFDNRIDFGSGSLLTAGRRDIFVAKLTPAFSPIWAHRFGDANDQTAFAAAVDPSRIIITGSMVGTTDFGAGPVTANGYDKMYVAVFDPSGNAIAAAVATGSDSATSFGYGVVPSNFGKVIVLGGSHGPFALGPANNPTQDYFDAVGNFVRFTP